MSPDLLVERDAGIVTVTLNRPEQMNAITRPMWRDLAAVFGEVANRREDRVLILTGAPPAFCSGADLSSPEGKDMPTLSVMRDVARAAMALQRLPKPTIAKVDGPAVGAGFSMALACDFVAVTDRSRLSAIFTRRAMSVDFGGSWLLPRLVGLQRAKQIVFLAEMLSPQDAERMGLVNLVGPPDTVDSAVREWAERLRAGSQLALSLSKDLLNRSFETTLEQALEAEAYAQTLNIGGPDTREARRAFLEKREPRYGDAL